MIKLTIPGFGDLAIKEAIFDYNGTLAIEGNLIEGITKRLNILSERLHIHIVTGDSYGKAKSELTGVNCKLTILSSEKQALSKKDYLHQLNPKETVTIGNGRNDQYMLKEAALSIAILSNEGTAIEAIKSADILVPDIFSALDLLQHPSRLIATLRS